MPTIEDLEKLSDWRLVKFCELVSEDPSTYTQAVADEAFELKREWIVLARGQKENWNSKAAHG